MDFIQQFDNFVLYYILNNWHNDFTDTIFCIISNLSNYGFIWILMSVIMLFNRRWRTVGIILLLSLGVSSLIGSVMLKNIVCRIRPFNADPSIELLINTPGGYYSFPSGHSIAAGTGAAVTLMKKRLVGLIVSVYSLLLAFSRVFLAVHYLTDVIAGLALGAVISVLMWKLLYKKTEHFIGKIPTKQE